MKITLNNQYGEILQTLDLSEDEIKQKCQHGEIRYCTAGCNDGAGPDDLPIYHGKDN